MVDKDGTDHGRVSFYQICDEIMVHQLVALLLFLNFVVLDHELQNLANLFGSLQVQETEAKWINVHPNVDDLAISLLLLDLAQPVHGDGNNFAFSLLVLFIRRRH